MLLPLRKSTKITRQRFEFIPHPFLLHFDLLRTTAWKKCSDVCQHGIARYVECDVWREKSCEAVELRRRLWLRAREVVFGAGEVFRASPWRAEEHDVDLARRGVYARCERAEVGEDELDPR